MTDWVRLWHDMPTDPKWRVVARKSGQPLTAVLSVFVFMMTNASANADERGVIRSWDDEDVAAALDLDPEDVRAIVAAMQGKVIEGERLTGWEKRQPKREDASVTRVQKHREAQRNAAKRDVTHCNAPEAEAEAEADKKTEANASDAKASSPDFRDELWTEGVQSLQRQTGKTEASCRTFIGKCLREASDDCRKVLTTIRQAETDRVIDAPAWISKAVRAPPDASAQPTAAQVLKARIDARQKVSIQ